MLFLKLYPISDIVCVSVIVMGFTETRLNDMVCDPWHFKWVWWDYSLFSAYFHVFIFSGHTGVLMRNTKYSSERAAIQNRKVLNTVALFLLALCKGLSLSWPQIYNLLQGRTRWEKHEQCSRETDSCSLDKSEHSQVLTLENATVKQDRSCRASNSDF